MLVALVLVAMGLITRSTMVLENSRRAIEFNALRARLEADRQQRVAAAARKIDRYLASLIAIESLRSPRDYFAAPEVPDDDVSIKRSAAAMLAAWQENAYAQLYFQVNENNEIRVLAQPLSSSPLDRIQLKDRLQRSQWQTRLPGQIGVQTIGWANDPVEIYRVNARFQEIAGSATNAGPNLPPKLLDNAESDAGGSAEDPASLPAQEIELSVTPVPTPETNSGGNTVFDGTGESTATEAGPPRMFLSVGPIFPVWLDNELFLLRQVTRDGRPYLQGCWVLWPRLRNRLLRDLRSMSLPAAELQAVRNLPSDLDQPSFADWMPLQIVAPKTEVLSRGFPSDGGWLMVVLGWVLLSITCLSVGLLLQTVLRMSNRREAFVSSVTHELRTPLTTFRLYADLLAKNPHSDKTGVYAKTLQVESERLSHLIENVLCYSRMEKRGITSHHRVASIASLLESIVPRLEEHCLRSEMILDVDEGPASLRKVEILTDPSAVERILLNLVDNACKYGKTEQERVIELKIDSHKVSAQEYLRFQVADHGPGLSKTQKRRLFMAYNHGQITADTPNRTIGLGLNICFNLAKALGGGLSYHDNQPGCVFELRLPLRL